MMKKESSLKKTAFILLKDISTKMGRLKIYRRLPVILFVFLLMRVNF